MFGLAETAKLAVEMNLGGNFVSGMGTANQKLDGFNSKVGRATGHVGKLGTAASVAFGNLISRGLETGIRSFFGALNAGQSSLEDLEAVQLRTAAAIKSTKNAAGLSAEAIRAMAEAQEDLTTNDDKAIQNAENLLLTFTKIGKQAFPEALTGVLNLNAAMGGGDQGLAGTAIQVGKALNDPIKGITALRRVGVSFTASQEKKIKSLVAEGKLYDAQKLILAELRTEFGGQAGAFGTGRAADVRRLQDSVEDFQRELATGLAPAVDGIRRGLTSFLKDPEVLGGIKSLGENIAAFITPEHIDQGIGLIKDVARTISQVPWGVIGDSMQLAGTGAKIMFDAFTGLPDWLKTAVITGWGLNKLTGGFLGSVASGLIKGVLGITAGVVNVNGGVVNGAGGLAGAAGKGGISALGKAALIGEGIALAGIVAKVQQVVSDRSTAQAVGAHASVSTQINRPVTNVGELATSLAAVETGIRKITENPLLVLVQGDALKELQQMRAELSAKLASVNDSTQANFRATERADREASRNAANLARVFPNSQPKINAVTNVTVKTTVSVNDVTTAIRTSAVYGTSGLFGPGHGL